VIRYTQIILRILVLLPLVLALFRGCGGGGGAAPPPSPSAITAAATGVSPHTATLNGTVNPHAQDTTAWFEWGTDSTLAVLTVTTALPVGAGSADVSIGSPITGLTLGTTYYYRVAAANASGTQKGAIASFPTALPDSPPGATTGAATSVTLGSATLNGTVNPNELETTAVFAWGTDANLNMVLGTTPSQPLGAGTTSVAVAASLTGLAQGVTYYFRVTATNAAGTSNGTIVRFDTAPLPPTATTGAATSITIEGATLNGTVNPNGLAVSDYHFEYGTDSTLVTILGTSSSQVLAPANTGQAVTASLTGLAPGTRYYFRIVATNTEGTSSGAIVSLETGAQPPTATAGAATSITIEGATLNGTVNPNGLAVSDYHFEYGTDSTLVTILGVSSSQVLAAGFTGQAVTASMTGRAPGTRYYFRVVATNAAGTTYGSIANFTTATPGPPSVQVLDATGITTGGVTLNGNANPNGQATVAHFECSVDPNMVGSMVTPDQAIGNGSSGVSISAPIDVLTPSTTYYFRVVATNAAGTTKGTILSFTAAGTPQPTQGMQFGKLFSTFGGSGTFSLDFSPIREYGSGGYISIRIMDTPTTYFEFSTDPSRAWFIKVRKGFVVDSASFPYTYSQGGTYPIRITMAQNLSTVEAFGGTATLSLNDNSNPLVYFEVWTSDQDAHYDNIVMVPGFFDDFSTDTTGSYSVFYIAGTNSTFTYDLAGKRGLIQTGLTGGP